MLPLLNTLLPAYKVDMRKFILSMTCVAIAALAPGVSMADPDFNGEVLLAPPPPNWTGGTPETVEGEYRRIWKRDFLLESGVVEHVIVSRRQKQKDVTASAIARTLADSITKNCIKKTVSKIKRDTKEIGIVASFTAQCDGLTNRDDMNALFAMANVYAGEFNNYVVERLWMGNSADPGSPANSPRTGEQWATFFARISICNTLESTCNPAQAEIVHAHPRFTTMRALPVSARPVVPQKDLLKAAKAIGQLTGRAEACGEDTTPLTSKIDRMFARVTENDRDSSSALAAFKAAKAISAKAQAKRKESTCGPVRRDFRQHPSRVSAFYRYVSRFI